jgi:ribosomal protein S18 acetylase RimI-like enzyme
MSKHRKIADLFQKHREELGFVNEAQVRESDSYDVTKDGRIVGAAIGNHCVRKPQTTLYDIAVDENFKRSGIGRELVERMADDSPHKKIVAKCPVDLPAMQFYNNMDWKLVDVEDGKNTPLAVWRYDI